MEDFGWSNRLRDIPDTQCHCQGRSSDEALREQEYRKNHYERFLSHKAQAHTSHDLDPYSNYMDHSCRDIQKRRIREELIETEFSGERALKDEARMELMLKREKAHRDRNLPLHHFTEMDQGLMMRHPPSAPTPDPTAVAYLTSLEEKISYLVEEVKEMKSMLQSQGSQIESLQRGMKRISETEHLNEAIKRVKLSGLKRKALAPPEVDFSGLPRTVPLNKKAGIELCCSLCGVNISTEQALNEHLHDRKHRDNVDAMGRENAREHCSIRLLSKSATSYTKIIETVNPPAAEEAKLATPCIPLNETEEAETRKQESPQLRNLNIHNLETQITSAGKEEISGDASTKNTSSCDMCKIGPVPQKTMDGHVKGNQDANLITKNDQQHENMKTFCPPSSGTEAETRKQESVHQNLGNVKTQTKSAAEEKISRDVSKTKMFQGDVCKIEPMSQKLMVDHVKQKKHVDPLKKNDQKHVNMENDTKSALRAKGSINHVKAKKHVNTLKKNNQQHGNMENETKSALVGNGSGDHVEGKKHVKLMKKNDQQHGNIENGTKSGLIAKGSGDHVEGNKHVNLLKKDDQQRGNMENETKSALIAKGSCDHVEEKKHVLKENEQQCGDKSALIAKGSGDHVEEKKHVNLLKENEQHGIESETKSALIAKESCDHVEGNRLVSLLKKNDQQIGDMENETKSALIAKGSADHVGGNKHVNLLKENEQKHGDIEIETKSALIAKGSGDHVEGNKHVNLLKENEQQHGDIQNETKSSLIAKGSSDHVEGKKHVSLLKQNGQQHGNMENGTKSALIEEGSGDHVEVKKHVNLLKKSDQNSDNVENETKSALIAKGSSDHVEGNKHVNLLKKDDQQRGNMENETKSALIAKGSGDHGEGNKHVLLKENEQKHGGIENETKSALIAKGSGDHVEGKKHVSLLKKNDQQHGDMENGTKSALIEKGSSDHVEVKKHANLLKKSDQKSGNVENETKSALIAKGISDHVEVNKHVSLLKKNDQQHGDMENGTKSALIAKGSCDHVEVKKHVNLLKTNDQQLGNVEKETKSALIAKGSGRIILLKKKAQQHGNVENETKSALIAEGSDDRGKVMSWCDLCKVGPMSEETRLAHEKGKKHTNLEKHRNCGADRAEFEKFYPLGNDTHQVTCGMKITSDNIDETLDIKKLEDHSRTTKINDDCVVGAVKTGDHGLMSPYLPNGDVLVGVRKSVFERLTPPVNSRIVCAKSEEHTHCRQPSQRIG